VGEAKAAARREARKAEVREAKRVFARTRTGRMRGLAPEPLQMRPLQTLPGITSRSTTTIVVGKWFHPPPVPASAA